MASLPGYGTLIITMSGTGWNTPSATTTDPGYFTVTVNSGTLVSSSVSGGNITVEVAGLAANTGQITVTYGDTSAGGPGATAPANCWAPGPGAGGTCFRIVSYFKQNHRLTVP